MMLSAALLLTLAQAPAPGAEIMSASAPRTQAVTVDDGIRALALSGDPVLANGIVVVREMAPAPVAIRSGRTDSWGCLYGQRICRHESAIVVDNRLLSVRRYVPNWPGSFMFCPPVDGYNDRIGASCQGLLPGCGYIQCDLYWRQDQIAREFEETSVGLRAGRAITAARERESGASSGASSGSRSGSSNGYSYSAYSSPSGSASSSGTARASSGSAGGSARGVRVE